MLKILLPFFIISNLLYAAEAKKCDKCTVAKEYMRCTYYVEQKGDLSYQDSCMLYAKEMERNNNNGRAAWYYLAAGDFDSAIRSGEKALKVGENYASEHIAEAYLLKDDKDKAKNFFKKIGKSSKDAQLMTIRHFSILAKLYPNKFSIDTAQKLYDNR